MLITVFTPTYNRGYIIHKLYESLLEQTEKNFEWVVVDDGSTDDTESIINTFASKNNGFNIIYKKQINGGKHTAINAGVSLASGELFFIVDSDDYLTNDAISLINRFFSTIEQQSGEFAGCSGLRIYSSSLVVGSEIKKEYIDCTSLERWKYGILGDKAEIFYTDILRKYPFPVFEGEKFVNEILVWFRIANDGYKIRWFNNPIYVCDYLDDGLTKRHNIFEHNFYGLCQLVKEMKKYKGPPIIMKLRFLLCACYLGNKKGIPLKRMSNLLNCPKLEIMVLTMLGVLYKRAKKEY